MKKEFDILNIMRSRIGDILGEKSLEYLTAIPKGFNNNILWNAAHMISINQLLTYHQAGLNVTEPKRIVFGYKKGTFPEEDIDPIFVSNVKTRLITSIKQLERDYHDGVFKSYKPYTLSSGLELNSVEDAIKFDIYHTGYHSGAIQLIQNNL